MSRTNEMRHMSLCKTCSCKFRLDPSVYNKKQRWNSDKCRCEFKELIATGKFHDGFVWNPSIWECECDKPCDVEDYLFKF